MTSKRRPRRQQAGLAVFSPTDSDEVLGVGLTPSNQSRQPTPRTELLLLVCAMLVAGSPAFAQTWGQSAAPTNFWWSIASSADGTRLVAAAFIAGSHRILTSTNAGAAWLTKDAPVVRPASVASSADAVILAAVQQDRIWFSVATRSHISSQPRSVL